MRLLADLIIHLAEWVEAEFKAIQRGVLHGAIGGMLIAAAALAWLCGSALWLWSLFAALAPVLTPAWAQIAVGLTAAAAAAGLAWAAVRVAR